MPPRVSKKDIRAAMSQPRKGFFEIDFLRGHRVVVQKAWPIVFVIFGVMAAFANLYLASGLILTWGWILGRLERPDIWKLMVGAFIITRWVRHLMHVTGAAA